MRICIPASVCILLSGALSACEPANASHATGLTERVEALEKRVAALEKQRARPQPKRPAPNVRYKIPVSATDAYRGGKHAKVTIVEAFEYACPYCAMVEPALSQVLDSYSDEDVKVVSKQFVVHPNTATAPALAVCAAQQQGRFEAFNELLWARAWPSANGRPRLVQDQLARPALLDMARETGMDIAAFERAMDSAACKQKLQNDRVALSRIGVHGTPYVFINGKIYNGPRSKDGMKAAIDKEIKAANQVIGEGVSLEGYYAHLMKSARAKL